jgi:6-phosphofructokinase
MKVGLLTGGGDCPGLNAVIRAVVRKGCFHYEDEFVGFLEGWRGLVEDKSMAEFCPAAEPFCEPPEPTPPRRQTAWRSASPR